MRKTAQQKRDEEVIRWAYRAARLMNRFVLAHRPITHDLLQDLRLIDPVRYQQEIEDL